MENKPLSSARCFVYRRQIKVERVELIQGRACFLVCVQTEGEELTDELAILLRLEREVHRIEQAIERDDVLEGSVVKLLGICKDRHQLRHLLARSGEEASPDGRDEALFDKPQ